MINNLSIGSNVANRDSGQFEGSGRNASARQQMTHAGTPSQRVAARDSTPSSSLSVNTPAFAKDDLAALMQGVETLIQMFKRFFSQFEGRNEKPVTPKKVEAEVHNHDVSKKTPVKAFPHMSSKRVGEKPVDVWLEFNRRERQNDNESSIKAAMMKYGQHPKGIYSSIEMVGAGYEIVMRDGFKINLSPQEIIKAQQRTRIWSPKDPDMAKDINFLVAGSIKRVQIETGLDSFDRALEVVQEGADLGNGFKRLGLEAHVRRSTWPELHASRGLGVVLSPFGVQFGFDGNVDCCSQRSALTQGHADGSSTPFNCDALELI